MGLGHQESQPWFCHAYSLLEGAAFLTVRQQGETRNPDVPGSMLSVYAISANLQNNAGKQESPILKDEKTEAD